MGETTRDLFLYGGLAVGAYFIVKSLTEPLSKPINAASDLVTTGINTVGEVPPAIFATEKQAAKNIYRTYNQDYKTVESGINATKNLFSPNTTSNITPQLIQQKLNYTPAQTNQLMSQINSQTFYSSIQNPQLASSVITEKQKVSNAIITTAKYTSPVYVVSKGVKAVGSALVKGATGIFKGATVKVTTKK
jgi:hypothetical protein